ncbi:hypothetical protein OCGS_2011 [Oceaniovalibus guishaninsula JLT2003]|uniref:DUF1289 domain-containing protein n=1 Tax=Oceaniovalibus guishaninsula JLT2003 TaxID=1231392 RepID=K2I536_9RHOB|nr:DUF1289 domain-containing protein [Oceaniovalibus guishaninsula]EKE44030.1 hypothetical protein OCGS_2011 [Oceaniovalibus guishaninsula JLT2003]
MKKLPSPCIDVCKFRREGHCIGCSMTKAQKKLFKSLKRPEHRAAFIDMLIHQQGDMGRYSHWAPAYLKKCAKKDVKAPPGLLPKGA